jgi:hypothetical protein
MKKRAAILIGAVGTFALAFAIFSTQDFKASASAEPRDFKAEFIDYRIALVAEGGDAGMSPELASLSETLGSTTLTSAADFVEQDTLDAFDAVLFTGTSLADVDPVWLRTRYWDGLILVDLNGAQGLLPGMLKSESCPTWVAHPALGDNYFLLRSQVILAEFPNERASEIQNAYDCESDNNDIEIRGYVVASRTSTQMSLTNDEGYTILLQSLSRTLRGVRNNYQAFVTRSLQRQVTLEEFSAAMSASNLTEDEIFKLWKGDGS